MAILTVTVFKINGEYFPGGCERSITCGSVMSLNQNVKLKMPNGAPLTCDEDLPEDENTEIIVMKNGDKWWIQQDGESIIQQCIDANDGNINNQVFELTEDGEISVSNGLVVAIGIKGNGGDQVVSVGTTPGGIELVDNTSALDGIQKVIIVGYTSEGTTILYITGITQPTTIKLYKL